MQQLITLLKQLLATNPKDRYIKGHAKDLLTRLQALNPQENDQHNTLHNMQKTTQRKHEWQ